MQSSKWWLDSATVKGIIFTTVSFVAIVLKMFGVEILPGEQSEIANTIGEVFLAGVGFFGLIKAIIGRANANMPLRGSRY